MILVSELDRIAKARLEDAKALLQAGRYDGATYLCGYAVELALKARICRTLNWVDFPNTKKEFESYRSFQTHDLEVLLHLSGKEAEVKQQNPVKWNSVAAWRPEWRYNVIGSTTPAKAKQMIWAAKGLLKIL